jgi:hypothetical protein
VRPLFKYPQGDKVGKYHIPATLADYRTYLPCLPHGPRPAGRARPLAVRAGVGQPRVLVAGIPGHPGVRRQAATRADEEGRGQPGVVGIPAGACLETRQEQGSLRSARGQGHAHHRVRRERLRPRRGQRGGGREPDYLPRVPLRPQCRADPHRQPLVQDRPTRTAPRWCRTDSRSWTRTPRA